MQDLETLRKDPDLVEMINDESFTLKNSIDKLKTKLRSLLYESIEQNGDEAFVEVRPGNPSILLHLGTGGDEACLFAMDIFNVMQLLCQSRNWKCSVIAEASEGEMLKSATIHVRGVDSFSILSWEAGVHRVQRVPETENKGRIHTSTATVAVLKELEGPSFTLKDTDVRIDTYRSSGAGGQHANKTNSAVRAVHIPTGVTVCIQDERDQQKNKLKALQILTERLSRKFAEEARSDRASVRQSQIGSAERSDKIRTYNYPQDRITDHRVPLTLHGLAKFFDGRHFEEIYDSLLLSTLREKFDHKVQ